MVVFWGFVFGFGFAFVSENMGEWTYLGGVDGRSMYYVLCMYYTYVCMYAVSKGEKSSTKTNE